MNSDIMFAIKKATVINKGPLVGFMREGSGEKPSVPSVTSTRCPSFSSYQETGGSVALLWKRLRLLQDLVLKSVQILRVEQRFDLQPQTLYRPGVHLHCVFSVESSRCERKLLKCVLSQWWESPSFYIPTVPVVRSRRYQNPPLGGAVSQEVTFFQREVFCLSLFHLTIC